jgi:lipopolysaccharide export system permease protein
LGTLERYLAREILLPFAAGLLFLTQVLVATQILAQGGILFGPGVSATDVARVALDLVPHFLGYVLPVAFLLGAVIGVGRLAEDREVIALGASGVSPVRLVRVPLLVGLAVAAVALAIGLRIEPMALHDLRLRVNDLIRRNVSSEVRGGVFYDQLPALTLYAESVSDGRWSRVLIADRTDPDGPLLALAQRGRLEPAGTGSDLRLLLDSGELYRESRSSDDFIAARFRNATITLGIGSTLAAQNRIVGSLFEMTPEQIAARIRALRAAGDREGERYMASFLWRRIAAPLSILAFALVAVPLAATRRGGRAFGYTATMLSVLAYYALMRFGEGLSHSGALPTWLGPQLGNLLFAAAGLLLVALLAHRGAEAVR